jgi:iron complex outermembrane receptor protein
VGSVQNKGYEIALGGKPLVTKNFTWDIQFNLAHNTNRVKGTVQQSAYIKWFVQYNGRPRYTGILPAAMGRVLIRKTGSALVYRYQAYQNNK